MEPAAIPTIISVIVIHLVAMQYFWNSMVAGTRNNQQLVCEEGTILRWPKGQGCPEIMSLLAL